MIKTICLAVQSKWVLTGLILLGMNSTTMANSQWCQNKANRNTLVADLKKQLSAHYIFPEKVAHFADVFGSDKNKQALSVHNNCNALTDFINSELAKLTKDKHLRLTFSEEVIPQPSKNSEQRLQQEEQAFFRSLNYGVEAVERLPFNIGYIRFLLFADAQLAAPSIAAAMNLIHHTDALIIDLRENRGGDPNTVDLFASYLLNERTNTSNIYYRATNTTEQRWTSPSVSGLHYGETKPLYILTSKDTFSAAEDLAYTLKHLKRAIIIGETSGGGAHPGDFYRLNDHFEIFIPNARSINPVTQTNWESEGVVPHHKVSSSEALNLAQKQLLSTIMKQEKSSRRIERIKRRIEQL